MSVLHGILSIVAAMISDGRLIKSSTPERMPSKNSPFPSAPRPKETIFSSAGATVAFKLAFFKFRSCAILTATMETTDILFVLISNL